MLSIFSFGRSLTCPHFSCIDQEEQNNVFLFHRQVHGGSGEKSCCAKYKEGRLNWKDLFASGFTFLCPSNCLKYSKGSQIIAHKSLRLILSSFKRADVMAPCPTHRILYWTGPNRWSPHVGPVQRTKLRIQVHGLHMTTRQNFGRRFRVFHPQWQLLLCPSVFTICALLSETIFDRCVPRMRCDTSQQAQQIWRSFPLQIFDLFNWNRQLHALSVSVVTSSEVRLWVAVKTYLNGKIFWISRGQSQHCWR